MNRFLTIFLLVAVLALGLVAACGDDDDDNDDDNDDNDTPVDDDDDTSDDDDDQTDDDAPVDPYLNPEEPGPYLAGNTTFFFEDASRELSCGDGNRWLMTEVWYPAADNADEWSENWVTDFFLDRQDEVEEAMRQAGMNPDEELIDQPTGSYRDAPVHPDATSMPVLIFSHGFSSNRFQNYTMANYLASHGYLVVAPDHICNAGVTLTPTDVVLFSWLDAPLTLFERVPDVRFLADVFLDTPPDMFAGRIDVNRLGYMGHSFGGLTVTEAFKRDLRATALVQLASFGFPDMPEQVVSPSMFMWGREDKWMHIFEPWHDIVVDLAPRPKFELQFNDTGHFAFADLCDFSAPLAEDGNGCGTEQRIGSDEMFTNPGVEKMHEVMNPYITAFLGMAFFDYDELAEYLTENHFPELIEYFPVWE